ncbi:MAG TPA: hypothetical protein VGQ92_04170 [Actinoplanes sp.]|nr:hypothetical protein [Actinoplanes sp.]
MPVPVEIPAGYWTREASHTPLPWRPFSRAYADTRNAALRRMASELGLLFDGVELQQIGGWEYMRIVPLGGKQPPRLPDWLVPLAFRLVPAARRRIREAVAAMRSDAPARLVQRWSREWQPDFDARIRRLRESRPSAMSDTALGAHLDSVVKLAADGVDVHFRLHGALAVVVGEFAFTCRDLLGWDETRMLSLLCGTSITSTRPARALTDLAALAGPPVRALLTRGAPVDEVLGADEEFAAAFDAYVREYGCRALTYEIADPPLEERPELVLGLVRDQLDGGLDARADETLARQREAVANEAREILGGADLLRFERVLERALAAYPVREDNEFFTVSAPLGLLRRTALELGNRLADRGQITAAEDIFFVHVDEARTVLADGTDARHIVARHKGEHGWVVAHPGPASYGRDPGPPPPMRGLPDEARLANEAFLWAVDRILAPDAHGGSRDSMLTGTPLRRAATPARYGSSAPRPSSTGSTAATFSCAR